MLCVDLPEAAWGRLAERAQPAWAQARAGVGPGPRGWGDLEPRASGRAAGGPAEMRGCDLACGLLGRSRSGAGIRRLTGDLGVVEVLFSLGLIWTTSVCGRSVGLTVCVCVTYMTQRNGGAEKWTERQKRQFFSWPFLNLRSVAWLSVSEAGAL